VSEDKEKDPWRFYQAEHLWKKMAVALEQKEIVEQRLYISNKLIDLFLERDELMQVFHESPSDNIKKAMMNNLAAVNSQIDSLLIYLHEETDERESRSVDHDRETSTGGLEDGGLDAI
jgi:hypothetical protein